MSDREPASPASISSSINDDGKEEDEKDEKDDDIEDAEEMGKECGSMHGIDSGDDDDAVEEEEEVGGGGEGGSNKGIEQKSGLAAELDDDDDDDDDNDEDNDDDQDDDDDFGGDDDDAPNKNRSKKTASSTSSSKTGGGGSSTRKSDNPISISEIDHDLFITFSKRTYGIPDDVVRKQGVPFPCESGEEMGKLLSSKSPDSWIHIKTKHVTILEHEGVDFIYIACYVQDSSQQEFDKRRLHPIPKPVCKSLVDRFNNAPLKPQKRKDLERLLSFRVPTEEEGVQIDPKSAKFPIYQAESCRIPTARVKPQSKPRQLKSSSGKYGRKTALKIAAAAGAQNASNVQDGNASQESGRQTQDEKRNAGKETAKEHEEANRNAHTIVASNKRGMPLESSSYDLEDGAGSASVASSSRTATTMDQTSNDISLDAVTGFKRLRTLKVEDPNKTHVHIADNGLISILEYA